MRQYYEKTILEVDKNLEFGALGGARACIGLDAPLAAADPEIRSIVARAVQVLKEPTDRSDTLLASR